MSKATSSQQEINKVKLYSQFSNTIKASLFILSLSLMNNCLALKEDKNQPIKLNADEAKLDDVSQEYVLIGNVKLVKGSLVIIGDKAVVVVDPEGYQKITVASKPGELADFSQRMDGPFNESVEGHGEFIFYDGKTETLLIKGKAKAIKRIGVNWRDKLDANEIFYDLATEKFKAISNDPKFPARSVIAPKRANPS